MTQSTSNVFPQDNWLRLSANQHASLQKLQEKYGLDVSSFSATRAAVQANGFLIIPVDMVLSDGHCYSETRILFALKDDLLISIEQPASAEVLDHIHLQLLKQSQQKTPSQQVPARRPNEVLFLVLEALNNSAYAAIREISACLDERSEVVANASGGFEMAKQQTGVADIASTAIGLGEAEELVAKMVEGQLMLARASRWLRRVIDRNSILESRLPMLISDIHSLRRYAVFQHDKIRNLQQSLMTTMDLKQNQVVKVFTVVTAVFTPPTLIAAFYGQNFAYMPELEIYAGEWIVMALTAVFALMPLAYIKRKGWMR